MYLFLAMLSTIDLVLSSVTMPKMASLFLTGIQEIEFNVCLAQMFLIHALSAMESAVLLAMAFDRFVAICHPLRHASVLTGPTVAKIGLAALTRGFAFFFPLPFLLKRLSYCQTHTVTHSFCLHQDIMKLSCTDTTVNVVYGLFIILSVMGVDSLFIGFSYILILRAVLELSSRGAALKAFNTCISHLCAVLVFYMFAIHSLSGMESTVLLAMAFDRYVAICHPLRHATVLTLPRVAKIGMAAVVRGAALMAPLPVFIKQLPFCRSNILSHSYCLHQDVMKLACADIHVNVIYGLIVIISAIGLDSVLISLSYLLILKTVLGLTREAQTKAFGTCVSHVCAVFIFYVPFIGLSMVHRFGKRQDSLLPIIMANTYLLVPPVLNPIVYGVKTKEIRQRILHLFHRKGLEMATKRSNDMARSTEDSTTEKEWRKNICTRQALKAMRRWSNQSTARVVGIVDKRKGLEMATKRSNDMARSTEDSTTEKEWRKNICTRQALKAMRRWSNQSTARVVGIVDKECWGRRRLLCLRGNPHPLRTLGHSCALLLLQPNCRQTPPPGATPPTHPPSRATSKTPARCPRGPSVLQHSQGADAELNASSASCGPITPAAPSPAHVSRWPNRGRSGVMESFITSGWKQ
ncbi:hypothetical protein QTO34_003849 [Cnephaeus nilssonii]|uniref:G-protein coupled receptors family 1 profile domain-containing protein n=1 Tax=Cnephaeus nilssonii TaxID=3371016 RepID=A0AA40HRL5_CNENI|nr:hypothetical protein QTO34_003849 [Eptesicus nilssonii]